MNKLLKFIKKIEPKKGTINHTLYDGLFTFLFTPNDTTTPEGVHIRDRIDLKRTMVMVVLALQLCYLFGTYNIGHQHFQALGIHTGFFNGFHLKLAYGLTKLLPLFIWTHVVGLGIEFYFAWKKGHPIEEGFLVSGALIPLIMPPDLPIWMLCLAVAFAVFLGKEAFGGTGMNIWNVALLARAFVFFAYPTTISGDQVWIAGFENILPGAQVEYGWWQTSFFNTLFEWFGWAQFDPSATIIDGFTGATPLALAYEGGWDKVTEIYSSSQMFWGTIPGSIGETSKPLIILGALMLIITKIGSWRIMVSGLFGAIVMSMLFNLWGATPFMNVPWQDQLLMGSFWFAIVYMATDPVTAAGTNFGKLIYGFLIGMIGMIVRIINPAYPEGWMLAILFMNTMAPLMDHYIVESNMKKRLKSA
ncbi:NADH:ubiquinone reductase (Na(+)-transporting) subunit B [Membranicola marinus]|uniref:Na(+)-translocating NADH-quinone reductase subunit B n=1 Tax=Membranihabitans marinus TaxID=1227546 RepID=A0A953LA41_9BACT|nr:NADH:ubiquinone reductase (Na(+)-transporting) subunit B [Membranihabitans marinus]MBY5957251.1 NADH:ubiquinone reductase (Na(+)-transporting) subunit B [Membranihabitans marinus]